MRPEAEIRLHLTALWEQMNGEPDEYEDHSDEVKWETLRTEVEALEWALGIPPGDEPAAGEFMTSGEPTAQNLSTPPKKELTNTRLKRDLAKAKDENRELSIRVLTLYSDKQIALQALSVQLQLLARRRQAKRMAAAYILAGSLFAFALWLLITTARAFE